MRTFYGSDILSIKQFTPDNIAQLFEMSDRIHGTKRTQLSEFLRGRQLLSAFFQNSTRTRLSFESAMLRLGGGVLGFADPKTTRAGDYEQESLEDTIQMCRNYADIIVLRHPTTGSAEIAAEVSDVPIINAGDGWGEHPTQILGDIYTMRQRCGRLDGLQIGLLGDFRVRCMHSMILALSLFKCEVIAVSPKDRWFDEQLVQHYERTGRRIARAESVDEILPDIDVLYMGSAIQQPNFGVSRDGETVKPKTPDEYCVNFTKLKERARPNLVVLDALARGDELHTDIDGSSFNGYWDEAANAVTLRMALLRLILQDDQ